jgi:hypothetical protein
MIHNKLMVSRIRLQGTKLKKTGHNKFAGYSYFELGDFLPEIQTIMAEVGICGVVSYTNEYAILTLTDIDDGTQIVITSPMSKAELKGAHPIQNLGAVETYQRRYLWMTAMEIVEHDALDSSKPADKVQPAQEDDEEVAARLSVAEPPKKPKFTPTARVRADVIPPPYVETSPEWTITIHAEDPEDWSALLGSATKLKLTFATSEDEVRGMFKVNRALYEKAKSDSPEVYDQIMDMFKAANKKFKDQ